MLESERVPADQPESKRLMVVLHGLGDTLEGYRWLPSALRLPWLHYLLVNAPTPYYGGFSWFDFAGDPKPGIEYSRKLLFSLLDRQREEGFPTDQTVLFGFSQGCLMAIDAGTRFPHQFAGLVGVSGYLIEPEDLLRHCSPAAKSHPILVTHGTRDPLLPIEQVRPQIALLKSAGLWLRWQEFDKEHTIAGEQELTVIRDFVQSCYK